MWLNRGEVLNKGRGRLAWGCFLGEGGWGSFVSVFVEQEDYKN